MEEPIRVVMSECPLVPGDEVEYEHDGMVGFTGKVIEARPVWVLTVKDKKGAVLTAQVSRWKKKERKY